MPSTQIQTAQQIKQDNFKSLCVAFRCEKGTFEQNATAHTQPFRNGMVIQSEKEMWKNTQRIEANEDGGFGQRIAISFHLGK